MAHTHAKRLSNASAASFDANLGRGFHRYDDDELDRLGAFIEPRAFVLDVGACFGFYTVPLALAANAVRARVVAFEPLAANVGILTANLALNQVENVVRVMPVGLGRATAEARMSTESSGVGNAAMLPSGDTADNQAAALVRVERLDDLQLPEEGGNVRCSLIKIDVEGCELDVLEGGERFVGRHRPVVFGEFSPWWMERRGFAPDAAQRWAAASDYRCYQLLRTRRGWWSDSLALSFVELGVGAPRSESDLLLVPAEAPEPG